MNDTSTISAKATADALAAPDAAEAFWLTLPAGDPLAQQRALCEVLAQGSGWARPDVNRFRALRQLDMRADRLLEGLLAEYAALGGQSPDVERQFGNAALELCHAFAQEYESFLRAAAGDGASAAWQQRTSELAVRLFRQREIELTLAMCRCERWSRGRWKAIHETFRLALARRVATQPVAMRQRSDKSIATVTPEQAYVRMLLLQLMDGGRFRAEEILSVRRHLGQWSATISLRRPAASVNPDEPLAGFVADLAASDGLVRAEPAAVGDLLQLDTTSVVQAIDAMIAERRKVAASATGASPADWRVDLLGKLKVLYAPHPVAIRRRGDRMAVALMSVEAMVGNLQMIFRMLRDEARRAVVASDGAGQYSDEITITDVGGAANRSRPAGAPEVSPCGVEPTGYSSWQVRDRSESGSRLRGRVQESRFPKPGMLIAFRDDKLAPWTVAVVRRVNRVIGNNIELGVEHLGHDPRFVILQSGALQSPEDAADEMRPDRTVAICLPESDACPRMPIKSLLLPACEFVSGKVMTMVSATQEVAIRLKEPLERHAEFTWTTFEVA